jgi:hypothetical protein
MTLLTPKAEEANYDHRTYNKHFAETETMSCGRLSKSVNFLPHTFMGDHEILPSLRKSGRTAP